MIRKSLPQTKAATYSMLFPSPDPKYQGIPVPRGTGFFIDPGGYFLTARHVIQGIAVEEAWLMQTPSSGKWGRQMVQWPELVTEWEEFDLALLKVDFGKNANKSHLVGATGFPHLPVDLEVPAGPGSSGSGPPGGPPPGRRHHPHQHRTPG